MGSQEGTHHTHIPGQQRHGLHPPDIDIEVCVDNTRVDAVHLHTLALIKKWVESSKQKSFSHLIDVSFHLSLHHPGQVLGAEHLRHLGVAVSLLRRVEPGEGAPITPVQPRAWGERRIIRRRLHST